MGRSLWESAVYHRPRPDDRQRDLFPLPQLQVEESVGKHLSRSVRRRVDRRAAVGGRVNHAIDALNLLFSGHGSPAGFSEMSTIGSLPLHQQEAINGIIQSVKYLGDPPADACGQGALKALRAAPSMYEDTAGGVGDVVPMSLPQLSLPSGVVAGVDLLGALEEPVKGVVAQFEDTMLQDADVWTAISSNTCGLTPYNDPALLNPRLYLVFLRHLYDRGILDFADGCKGRVGAFTVSKKPKLVGGSLQQRQRLVLDCRQTNLLFRPAPHTRLGSLAAISEMYIPPGHNMYLSGADIKDCFYAVRLPKDLAMYFGLHRDLSVEEATLVSGLGAEHFSGYGNITPVISVLPMGFSWSFFLVQHIHESVSMRALGISHTELVLEHTPAPKLVPGQAIAMPYCDNVHAIGLEQQLTNNSKDSICNALSHIGFSMHEDEPASTTFNTLGGVVDGQLGQVRATSSRMWNLIFAFMHIRRGVIHPEVVQRLLGHSMVLCVLNRCGMGVFHQLYKFAMSSSGPRCLNRRERQECYIFAGIVPLLYSDLRRPLEEEIHCTDASPDGFGICSMPCSNEEVSRVARWNERWRFRRLPPEEWQPRRRALGLDVFVDVRSVTGDTSALDELDNYVDNPLFEEVPCEMLDPNRWSTKKMGKWEYTGEHITLKEGRALVLCARRLARSSKYRGKRHVVLVDNLGLALAVSKGVKSTRVLTKKSHAMKPVTTAPTRTLRGQQSKAVSPVPRVRKHMTKTVKKDSVHPTSHWSTVPPAPMRQVGRVACRDEIDVGRRAQNKKMTVLEERSVSKEIHHQYTSYYNRFKSFCRQEGLPWPPGKDCDLVMADYLDILFLENRSANEGEKVVAALEFHHLELKGKMIRSKRALKGWRKEMPPKSRLPMPALVMYGVAMDLLARGKRIMGVKVIMDFDAYLRPGESIGLRAKDVLKPVRSAGPQYQHYSIIIRDQEDMVADKAGVFDNTVQFNTPGRQFIGEMVWHQAQTRSLPKDPLFPFTSEQFRKEFQISGKKLGLESLHPYQLRHGGASEDMNAKIREHAVIKCRGRWHTDQSVRRANVPKDHVTPLGWLDVMKLTTLPVRFALEIFAGTDENNVFWTLRAQPTLGGAATLQEKGEEKLVPSHWLRRWRQQLWESLPKGNPVVWAEPIVSQLCSAIWSEVAEHGLRNGDRAVNDAVGMFQDPSQEGRWSFIPGAELLLTVGEGLVGITALGLFVWPTWQDPIPPRSAYDLTALTRPNFAPPPGAMGPMGPVGAMGPGGPMGPGHIVQPTMSGMGMPKGSDREKIFVGGIPHHCTLEMLANYFSKYGRITDAVVMIDKNTGKPRGFGFVVFEHVSCVEAAIADYGKHAIDGKWVDVKRATPQDGSAPLPTTSTPVPSDADGGVAGASPERQNFREMPSQPGGVTSPEPKFKVPSPGGAGASPDRGFDQTAQQGATNGAGATSNFTSVPPPAM
eukprot:s342_g13.t1